MTSELSVTKYQRGPALKVVLEFRSPGNDPGDIEKIEEINIADLAIICIKFKSYISRLIQQTPGHHDFSIKLKKTACASDSTVKMNISCKNLNYSKQIICPEDWSQWMSMGVTEAIRKYSMYWSVISITIDVHKVGKPGFEKLYEDTELTDFYLHTDSKEEKGSVAMHKICLAAYSDVFKTMFSGQWKETQEDCIKIKGVTIETLKSFKKFIYLGTLPESSECRSLLLLAARYFIEDLKTECATRLALSVEPENLHSLHVLACANNIPELSIAISQLTPDHVIQSAYEIEKKKARKNKQKGTNKVEKKEAEKTN